MEPLELIVRRISSKETMHDFVLDYCHREGWLQGKMDDILMWVSGPDGAGVYVGELDGEPVTGVGMIQHSDSYAWVGLYYCKPEHRGKGYAFKTWQVARAVLDEAANPHLNLGLDAVVSASSLYETQGFKKSWLITVYYLSAASILEAYETTTFSEDVTISLATDVDFVKLRQYVEDVMGLTFNQPGLLEKWISLPTHKAIVALSKSRDIVGFVTARETITFDETGYRIAPLLADSGHIARFMLLKLAKGVSANQKFPIYIPSAETNGEAVAIVQEVKGQKYMDLVRMYTKGELPIKKEKYFGVFSSEILG